MLLSSLLLTPFLAILAILISILLFIDILLLLTNIIKEINKFTIDVVKTIHFIHRSPKHILHGNCLESKIGVFKLLKYNLLGQIKRSISKYIISILTKKFLPLWYKYPLLSHYISIIDNSIHFITYLYNTLLEHVLVRLEKNYPFSFTIIWSLYIEYTKILTGNLRSQHINFFIMLGILLKDTDYFIWLIIMTLADLVKNYVLRKKEYFLSYKVFILYPVLYTIIIYICTAIYLICLYKCMDIGYETFILPLVKKMNSFFTKCKIATVNMSGFGGGNNNKNNNKTPEPNPSPTPEPNPLGSSSGVAQKNKKKSVLFQKNLLIMIWNV